MLTQSPTKFTGATGSLYSLSAKKQLYNSTSSSFDKNSKTSFLIRKSSTTTFKNTQGKLDNLKQDLAALDGQVNSLRSVTRQSKIYLHFMREDLVERKLVDVESDLKLKMKELKKAVEISKRSCQLRKEGVTQTINQLKRSSINIDNSLHNLAAKMNRLENSIGFYCGSEKLQ